MKQMNNRAISELLKASLALQVLLKGYSHLQISLQLLVDCKDMVKIADLF